MNRKTTFDSMDANAGDTLAVLGQPLASIDPDLADDAEHLRAALSQVIRVAQFRDRDRVCCYDVSVSQCYALEALVDLGAATVNDLAGALYLDKSTASRLAHGLSQKGYVRRVASAEDGRSVVLEPTTRGRRLVERVKLDVTSEYAGLLAELEPEVRSSVVRVVSRLAGAFSARVDASGGTCCVIR